MSGGFDPGAAADLLLAVRAGAPRPAALPVTPPDLAAAYAVQDQVMRRLGGAASWKMALLGGRDRQAAALPARATHASGAVLEGLPADAAIEVETALVLGTGLLPGCTPGEALAAVGEVRLAFEIVGSRYADRKAVPPLDAMADSFSSAAIVLGDPIPDWQTALARPLNLVLTLDGQDVPVTEQPQPLDEASDFLAWLAAHAAGRRLPLSTGTVIITGARLGPIPLLGRCEASAFSGPSEVRARLAYQV